MSLPTVDQVRSLPAWLDVTVPPKLEDANGHVNVTGHLRLFDDAGWRWAAASGFHTEDAPSDSTLMDLEHHLRYLAELHVGARVRVHGRWLARGDKRLHGVSFLVDDDADRLVSTLEVVTAHVSLSARRSVPFPGDVAATLDEQIAAAERDWPAPTCGAMGVASRRS